VHFGIDFTFDRAANVADTLHEIGERRFLLVGIIGLTIMLPLAVTSTDGMIRRLGPKRWKALHAFAYVAAVAAALHFYLLVKADVTRPVVMAVLLGGLFAWRLAAHYRRLRSEAYQWRMAKPTAAAKPKSWTGPMTLVRVFNETPQVKTFRFALPDLRIRGHQRSHAGIRRQWQGDRPS
jgi:glycine betaine catabolism B